MKRTTFKPRLENLEDRLALSTAGATIAAVSSSVSQPQALPDAADLTVQGTLRQSGESDWFAITAKAGEHIHLLFDYPGAPYVPSYSPSGAGVEVFLNLFAAQRVVVPNGSTAAALDYTPQESGTFLVDAWSDFRLWSGEALSQPEPAGRGDYTLEITREMASPPDLVATALRWDADRGGVIGTFSVRGAAALAGPVPPPEVFWSRTPDAGGLIGSALGLDGPLGCQGDDYTFHVTGTTLRQAPVGAAYLVMVLDRGNKVAESNEGNNVLALADVKLIQPPDVHGVLSDTTRELVKGLMRQAGVEDAVITQLQHTPQQEVESMFEGCLAGGAASEAAKYGPAGDQVIAVYSRLTARMKPMEVIANASFIQGEMLAEMIRVGVENISPLVRDPNLSQVVELDPSSMGAAPLLTRFAQVASSARNDSPLHSFRGPGGEPGLQSFRLEVWQPARFQPEADFLVPDGQFTFDVEGKEGGPFQSRRPTVPTKGSGVTVGRGFDIAGWPAREVKDFLTAAGLTYAQADAYAGGVGLRGDEAKKYIAKAHLVEITRGEQKNLFEIVYAAKAADLRRLTAKPGFVRHYGAVRWDALDPVVRDLAYDLYFRGDFRGGALGKVLPALVANSRQALASVLSDKAFWVAKLGVPVDRFEQRLRYALSPQSTP